MNGDYQWAHSFGSNGSDCSNTLAIAQDETLYLSGEFSVDMFLNTEPETALAASGQSDIFILRLKQVQ